MDDSSGPYVGVQVLRFAAAALVLVAHTTFYASERIDASFPVTAHAMWGVWLFFAISGFVMQVSVAARPPRTWWSFAFQRIARIVPMYWAWTTVKLISLLLGTGFVLHATLDPVSVVSSYLFFPSYNVEGDVQPLYGVGWTLVFEMAFYALVTLAVALRRPPLVVCAPVLVVGALLSAIVPEGGPAWTSYASPVLLFFLAGMLVGRWVDGRRTGPLVGCLVLTGLLFGLLDDRRDQVFDPDRAAAFAAILALLFLVVRHDRSVARVVPRWSVAQGAASYALYLSHPVIGRAVVALFATFGAAGPGWAVVATVMAIVTCLCCAPLLYRFVERPVTERLRSWYRVRVRSSGAAPS